MQSLELVNKLLKEKYPDPTNKRYMHILGVKDMAIKLAQIYHEDVNKATIAALMHDYSKYDSIDDAKGKLSDEDIEECKKYPFLLHAYLSAYYYKELVGNDLDIYNAIRNHVFGRPNMSLLEKIIVISDYTEENRKYPSCIECRKLLFEKGIDYAIYYSTKKTIEFNLSEGNNPHPRQLEVLKEYEGVIKMTLEEVLLDCLSHVNAKDIIVYDMEGRSPFYDKMIIATVDSQRQATAVISYIEDETTQNNYQIRSIEGRDTSWVLVDCNDIIISIFTSEERAHFALEKIYMEIPSRKIN